MYTVFVSSVVLHGLPFHSEFQNQMEPKQKCEVRGSSGGLDGAYGHLGCDAMCVGECVLHFLHAVRPYMPVVFGSVPLTCVLEAAAAGSCAGTHPPPFAAVCEFSPATLGSPGLVPRGSAGPWIEPPDCWSPQLTATCTHEVIMCGPI